VEVSALMVTAQQIAAYGANLNEAAFAKFQHQLAELERTLSVVIGQ